MTLNFSGVHQGGIHSNTEYQSDSINTTPTAGSGTKGIVQRFFEEFETAGKLETCQHQCARLR